MADLTIAVCTRNRSRLLSLCLDSIVRSSADLARLEVLVVDNGSTDDTSAVAASYSASYRAVRVCVEPTAGLSAARNQAWREARSPYVAYVDDDCQVPPGWAAAALECIGARSPDIVGGPFLAAYDRPKPKWFRDEYGSWSAAEEARPLAAGEYVVGGNMVVRKALLERMGGFDPGLGMVAGRVAYGEETGFQIAVRRQEPDALIYWEPRLWLRHLVRPEKFSLLWSARDRFQRGRYDFIVCATGSVAPLSLHGFVRVAARELVRASKDVLRALFRRRKDHYPHVQNAVYELAIQRLFNVGRALEQYRRTRTGFPDQ